VLKLQTYLKDKTLILITHRNSLLALVNRIIVMEKGKILMDGPKDHILKILSTPPSPTPSKPS
jgi:ATP-binding cassette subfamily C protein LapB